MEPIKLFVGSENPISAIFVKNDILITGDNAGVLTVWNIETKRPNFKQKCHDDSILSIEYIQSICQIVSQSRDGLLKFWKLYTDKLVFINSSESVKYTFCKIFVKSLNKDDWLCNPLNDKDEVIEIIKYPDNLVTHQFTLNKNDGRLMCMHLIDSESVLAGCESGSLLWFYKTSKIWSYKINTCIFSLSINGMGKLVIGTSENTIYILQLNLESKKQDGDLNCVKMSQEGTNCVKWRNDGKIFAVSGWDGLIRVYSGRKGKELALLRWDLSHKSLTAAKGENLIRFGDDGLLYSSSFDCVLSVWDLYRN